MTKFSLPRTAVMCLAIIGLSACGQTTSDEPSGTDKSAIAVPVASTGVNGSKQARRNHRRSARMLPVMRHYRHRSLRHRHELARAVRHDVDHRHPGPYIARVMAAFEKVTPRTKGNRFGRAKRSARKQAMARLIKRGYSAAAATQIVNDAHDVFLLEAGAKDDAS